MEERTSEILTALVALRADIAGAVESLRTGSVPVDRQHALAARLIEVGDLLDEHADRQSPVSDGHSGVAGNGSRPGSDER